MKSNKPQKYFYWYFVNNTCFFLLELEWILLFLINNVNKTLRVLWTTNSATAYHLTLVKIVTKILLKSDVRYIDIISLILFFYFILQIYIIKHLYGLRHTSVIIWPHKIPVLSNSFNGCFRVSTGAQDSAKGTHRTATNSWLCEFHHHWIVACSYFVKNIYTYIVLQSFKREHQISGV